MPGIFADHLEHSALLRKGGQKHVTGKVSMAAVTQMLLAEALVALYQEDQS